MMGDHEVTINGQGATEYMGLFTDILDRGHELRVKVTGGSMTPFLQSGDRVTLQKAPVHTIHIGDIVLCRRKGDFLTLHRVLRKEKKRDSGVWRFYTKGDALDLCDAPFDDNDVLGRVKSVERFFPQRKSIHKNLQNRSSITANYLLAICHRIRSGLICMYVKYKQNL